MSDKVSQAIKNLRAFAIIMVVSFHSTLAYLASQPSAPQPFADPPYHWIAIPILDYERWFGFDLYGAFVYETLMPLMFFLSGLFVLSSLARRGSESFVYQRLWRLGVPFVFGVLVLMPLADYPVYRLSVAAPSFLQFCKEWLALPVWPSGQLWFLWELLAFDLAFVLIYASAPRFSETLARAFAAAGSPARLFSILVAISAVVYIPLAMIFGQLHWSLFGPFALEPDRVLLYFVYFIVAAGIGARGLGHGLLRADGALARRWYIWLGAAVGSFLLWMISMAPVRAGETDLSLTLIAYFMVALLVTSACFCFLALFLRFGTGRSRLCDSLSDNVYKIYLIHYVFVVWLQYFLLGISWPAIAKGATVFVGSLGLSWGVAVTVANLPTLAAAIWTRGDLALSGAHGAGGPIGPQKRH